MVGLIEQHLQFPKIDKCGFRRISVQGFEHFSSIFFRRLLYGPASQTLVIRGSEWGMLRMSISGYIVNTCADTEGSNYDNVFF